MPKKQKIREDLPESIAQPINTSNREEYISYLEMSVQLLQREINHLREQANPKKEQETPLSNSGLFNACSSISEVISDMHHFILEPYSVLESNIFLFDSAQKLQKAAYTETSATLEMQINHLEEQGIIDWAIEKKTPSLIPNLTDIKSESQTYFILNPLFIRANKMGIMIARTTKSPDSFDNNELAGLASIAAAAAAAIDNIKSAHEIATMNKRLNEMSRQMVYSSKYGHIWELANAMTEGIIDSIKIIEANINLLATGIGNKKRRTEIIIKEIDNIKSIIAKFSNVAAGESGETVAKPLNICYLIDDVILLASSQMQRVGVVVEKEYEDNNLSIVGIKPQLEQAILKIMLALRDKMPEGGRIIAAVFKQGRNKLMIRISDNVPGLSAAAAAKLIDTAEGESDLFIVKNIIEQQGGSFSLNSDIDKGTTFKLIFPVFKQN